VVAVLAGCSGSGGSSHRSPPSTSAPTSTSPSSAAPPAASGGAWETDQADLTRTGVDRSGTRLGALRRRWTSPTLDGQVYAEPLVTGGLVIVATENDTLYGINAATGQVAWSTHVGTPVGRGALPCGNIDPLGITSTPAIDPATHRLFALAETSTNGTVGHQLVALDPSTGAVVFRESADPAGMAPHDQQQRPALAVSGGRVYVAYGGLFGDCGTYRGWVVAAPTSGPGPLLSFAVAATNQGAIWAPAGPVIDGAGDVWVSTGNSVSTSGYDEGNSVLKLSPTLMLLDSFAPTDWVSDNAHDLDLGSTSPQLLAGGLVFQVGKPQTGYLLNQSHLGGVGGQVFAAPVCPTIGANAYQDPIVYVSCRSGIKAVRVQGGTSPSFQVLWSAPSAINGPPVIAGGAVWSVSRSGQMLVALDPATGAVTQQVVLGASSANYATPAVGDGLLVVATGTTVQGFAGS
jgi:outer membrane protein assembly factor BamB